jgi:alpha-L-fucosidase
VTAQKGNRIYVHVLDWHDPLLGLPTVSGIKTANLFSSGTPVSFENVADGLLLHLPKQTSADGVDTVIVLDRN